MRSAQFWILLLGSSFVSILFIKQIFLSRDLIQERRLLVDSQETASLGSGYENAWKQLAIHIYQASHDDPALAAILKNEKVGSPFKRGCGTGSAPATPPSTPPASSKHPSSRPTKPPP